MKGGEKAALMRLAWYNSLYVDTNKEHRTDDQLFLGKKNGPEANLKLTDLSCALNDAVPWPRRTIQKALGLIPSEQMLCLQLTLGMFGF